MPVRFSARVLAAAAAVAVVLGAARAAGGAGFWEQVAAPSRGKAERLVWDARQIPPRPENVAKIEALLREALAIDDGHFGALLSLAEAQSLGGRTAAAADTLERALRAARLPAQKAQCWFELGIAETRLGRYRQAIGSYDQRIDLGDADAPVYANAAELLMALGRLGAAEDRYRDAIRVDEEAGDRREHERSLALSHYGLGVALDRDGQASAAREAVGRALALDPGAAQLAGAGQPGSDVFFTPDGEVFYYLGLAWEVGGRPREAEQAFRDFLARQPKSPWAARARAHVDALAPGAGRGVAGAGRADAPPDSAATPAPRWRVAAVATTVSRGPLPAPLIDAAWKQRAPAIAECLDRASAGPPRGPSPPAMSSDGKAVDAPRAPGPERGEGTVRVALDVDIDGRGVVTGAAVRLPPPFDAGAAGRCMEDAVRRTLRVTKAAHAAPTSARIDALLTWESAPVPPKARTN